MNGNDRPDHNIPSHEPSDVRSARSGYVGPAKWTCWIVGAVFLLLALMGFASSDDMVMGVFMVNALHNLVHLVSGLVLLTIGFMAESVARATAWTFAAIYGIVMLLGFAGVDPAVELLHLNIADNWLHLTLTLLLAAGALLSHAQARSMAGRQIGTHRRA
jgi:hypothetical protein